MKKLLVPMNSAVWSGSLAKRTLGNQPLTASTTASFYEATARILREIKLSAADEIQYLDYMRQIGLLLQTFTCASVFTLDHLHRLQIHASGGAWNHIENTLENSTLKKKDENGNKSFSTGMGQRNPPGNPSKLSGQKKPGKVIGPDSVCWCYNLHKGCPYGDECYYPHVCSVEGCRQRHPAYKHVFGGANRPAGGEAKQSS
jgi:hypothetical protein